VHGTNAVTLSICNTYSLSQLLHKRASSLGYTCLFPLKFITFNADGTNYSTARGLHHVSC